MDGVMRGARAHATDESREGFLYIANAGPARGTGLWPLPTFAFGVHKPTFYSGNLREIWRRAIRT